MEYNFPKRSGMEPEIYHGNKYQNLNNYLKNEYLNAQKKISFFEAKSNEEKVIELKAKMEIIEVINRILK